MSRASARKELEQEVERVLSHSLGSNIFPTRGDGPSWKVDWPWMVLLSLAVLASFFLYGEDPDLRRLCWINVWTVGFPFVAMAVAYYWVKARILRVLSEQVFRGMTEKSLAGAARRLRETYRPAALWRTSFWTSAVWGIFASAALWYDLLEEEVPLRDSAGAFSLWLLCSLAFVAAAKVGANCTFYDAISAECRLADLDSFRLAPTESPLVHGMVQVGKSLVGFMAFSAVYMALLLVWVNDFPAFVIVSLTIFLLGSLGLGVTVYARVTARLALLVSRRRQRTLQELEARIRESAKSLSEDSSGDRDLLKLVLERRSDLGIPAAIRGAWPLLIQLATLVVAIWKVAQS